MSVSVPVLPKPIQMENLTAVPKEYESKETELVMID